jgi:hypothetical protein
MTKLKPSDYMGIALELLPCGIPLALDHITSRKIRNDMKYILDENNIEHAKELALSIDQQLRLDAQYKSFRFFDGVLTRNAKAEIYPILNRLRNEKEAEYFKRSQRKKADEKSELEMRVIFPEEIIQE